MAFFTTKRMLKSARSSIPYILVCVRYIEKIALQYSELLDAAKTVSASVFQKRYKVAFAAIC